MVVEDVMESEEERPVHQGCMAGFLHLFDLSGRRLHHTPRRLMSSSTGSAERSFQLDRGTPAPSSPPAAPRPSLQLPPLDLKDVSAAPSWRLPRFSLDSCAVVDGSGKYRLREIRVPPSPSVVARLMGLDALPHGDGGDGGHAAGELRRSASERVPRGDDPARFRFVDPAFIERPASPREHRPTSPAAEATRCAPDPAATPRGGMVQQRFDAREVFPDPAAHGGEIALYGEIERRLRKRGIAEPARDLDTLKQVLEALQFKGLVRHRPTPPPPPSAPPPPPIVVMRPASQQHPTSARQQRGPHSPQRRASSPAAQSPEQQFRRSGTFDAAGARSRIAQRAAQNNRVGVALFPDEAAAAGPWASSRWEFEPVLGDETSRKLERCGKLLSSIQAFTGGDADQQPSPVSVLHAASFLADEDSPSSSSGSKRAIDFNIVRSPRKAAVESDPEDDDSWPTVTVNPDYAYVAELVRLFHGGKRRDPADVYEIAEQRRQRRLHPGVVNDRRLLCGAVAEALERQRSACPWDPASWLRGGELLDHVWAEVRRAREPVSAEGLNDVTCSAIRRDLHRHPRRPGPEVADAVLHIERLVFKDLVADTIRELADADRLLPRRRLVF